MVARSLASGWGTKTRRSSRRRNASSSSQGRFDAATTMTRFGSSGSDVVRPSICARSSTLSRRLDSSAPLAASRPRSPMSASISSMKTMDGASSRATAKSVRAIFSDSPQNLLSSADAEQSKKRTPWTPATALARSVFPEPGGPKRRTPFQGLRAPEKNFGATRGRTTASLRDRFPFSRPTTSSKVTRLPPSPASISSTTIARCWAAAPARAS
mmetsp:Transcript_4080/g.13969  ORF Transcript_4080/g.13969 Transcript_4080/m.13969 type:complete len:213 (-) Transcript_4080:29-667(-)